MSVASDTRRTVPDPAGPAIAHLAELARSVDALRDEVPRFLEWGQELHRRLGTGGQLLVAGNGGSSALAGHLAAELVGRYQRERRAHRAVALGADPATTTALANDYGFEEVFARQIEGLARPGDVVLLLSTSGRSPNLLRAAAVARGLGCRTWAMTGPAPNPLASCVEETWAARASAPVVQELQQVAVHLVCEAFDAVKDLL